MQRSPLPYDFHLKKSVRGRDAMRKCGKACLTTLKYTPNSLEYEGGCDGEMSSNEALTTSIDDREFN